MRGKYKLPPFIIQTILSVPESHRLLHGLAMLADYTADREFHPAPKVTFMKLFLL